MFNQDSNGGKLLCFILGYLLGSSWVTHLFYWLIIAGIICVKFSPLR